MTALADHAVIEAAFCRVFRCAPDLARQLQGHAAVRTFAARRPLQRAGDIDNATFLIVVGRARALYHAPDGTTVLLDEYGPDQLFGGFADTRPYHQLAEITAIEAVLAAVFAALDFVALAERHACVGLAASRMLLDQLRRATADAAVRLTVSAVGRVHGELLRRAQAAPDNIIRPAPVISELALRVATTRETASRAVSALERRGIVRREPDALVVVAPQRLAEMVI